MRRFLHRTTSYVTLSAGIMIVLAQPAPALAAVGPASTAIYRDDLTLTTLPFVADVEIADVTGDGRADLVATGINEQGYRLVVWRQKSDGTLVAAPMQLALSGVGPMDLAIDDLDGNGSLDAAVSTDEAVSTFLQTAGALTAGPSYGSPREIDGVETADLNDDGRADMLLLETNFIDQFAVGRLQASDGSGFLARTTIATLPQVSSLTVGDANGDGRDDFALERTGSPTPIYLQGAPHTFSPIDLDLGEQAHRIEFVDVTGDGRADAVAGQLNAGLTIRPASSGGGWGPAQTYEASVNAYGMGVADVDGNGGNDVVLIGSGDFQVFQQQQDHTLLAGCRLPMPQGFHSAVGDLNGDGAADVVVGDEDIHIAHRLAAGKHLAASLTASGEGGALGAGIGGQLIPEVATCVEGGPVEIWGKGPSQTTFSKMAETDFQGVGFGYYTGIEVDQTGRWTFFSRWRGGDYFGRVQSEPFEVTVEPSPTIVEIEADPAALYSGEPLMLTAYLADGGYNPLPAGSTVRFYGSAEGTRTFLGEAQTDASGHASIEHVPTYLTTYQAEFDGTSNFAASISDTVKIEVYPVVSGRMTRFHHMEGEYAIYRPTDRVRYRTTVEPNRAGHRVTIYLWYKASGRWTFGGADDFQLGPDGSVTIYLRGGSVDRDRNYRFQSVYDGDRLVYNGNSEYSYFRVE